MAVESTTPGIDRLPDLDLPDLDGTPTSLRQIAADRPTVIVFACNHCPYVRSIEEPLGELARAYADVRWLAICSNDTSAYPDDDVPGLREQVARARWDFPYLIDSDQQVARSFGAACTPDFFVFGTNGQLVYRGAMDDARPRQPQPVDGAHLRDAINAAREDRTFDGGKPAMGCGIKWRSNDA